MMGVIWIDSGDSEWWGIHLHQWNCWAAKTRSNHWRESSRTGREFTWDWCRCLWCLPISHLWRLIASILIDVLMIEECGLCIYQSDSVADWCIPKSFLSKLYTQLAVNSCQWFQKRGATPRNPQGIEIHSTMVLHNGTILEEKKNKKNPAVDATEMKTQLWIIKHQRYNASLIPWGRSSPL